MSKRLSDMFKDFDSPKKEVQEAKKIEKIISPKTEKSVDSLIDPLIQPKKLIIASDLDLLDKSLEQTIGFDISNVKISQDDLWLLYRLKFGKGTRVKRSVLLPQFTEAFKKNLEKMKKKKDLKF